MVLINTGTYDANDNHGPLMNRVAVAMMLISLVATCLRIFARRLVHQQLWWDDWFTPIALAFSWGVTIIHIIAVEKGNFGRHILPTTTPSEIIRFLKCLFGVQVGYPIAIAAIKFSILFFYRRIFSIGPTKLPLVLLGAVVAAWAIAMIIMGIFSCKPVRGFWMREEIPTVCISEVTYLLAVAIPNVVTDIVLIIFPLPILWSLKVTMSHRIALSGIFLIGGFIVIISCLRLITVIQSNSDPDVTWALLPLGIFNVLEMNIGILCACLPSMAPLLRILMGKTAMTSNPTPPAPSGHSISTSGRKPWSSSKRSNTHGLSVLESQNESVTWLNDAPTTHTGVVMRPKTSIHGPEPSQIELHQMKDDGKIRVDRNITWSES